MKIFDKIMSLMCILATAIFLFTKFELSAVFMLGLAILFYLYSMEN